MSVCWCILTAPPPPRPQLPLGTDGGGAILEDGGGGAGADGAAGAGGGRPPKVPGPPRLREGPPPDRVHLVDQDLT